MHIVRGFNAQTFPVRFSDLDAISVFQPAQLFEGLGFFQRRYRKPGNGMKDVTTECVQAYVLVEDVFVCPFALWSVVNVGYGGTTEIQGDLDC